MGKKILRLAACMLILMFFVYGVLFTERVVKPNLVSLGEIEARSMITGAMSDAIRRVIADREDLQELVEVVTDESGRVTSVNTWAVHMVGKGAELSSAIQANIDEAGEQVVRVPAGAVLGSPVLSQTDFDTKIRVRPVGTVKVALKSNFEEKGINQTKYKVYLAVNAGMRIVSPFSAENITLENEYLLAEVIVVGDVPDSYVIVPGDEVLDVI